MSDLSLERELDAARRRIAELGEEKERLLGAVDFLKRRATEAHAELARLRADCPLRRLAGQGPRGDRP